LTTASHLLQAVKLEKECPLFWHCVSTLLQSFGTFHEMLGFQHQMFNHNSGTTKWLDKLDTTVSDGYHEAWIEQGSRSSRLRYYIALDVFEYAANADIAHISKLVIENLEALEKIRVRLLLHATVSPVFTPCLYSFLQSD